MTKSLKNIYPLLQVKILDASVQYYVEKLGFKEAYRDEGGFAILCRDDCRVLLAQRQKDVDLRNQTARMKVDGYACYDFHVECSPGTIDDLWNEFKAAGAAIPKCFDAGPIDRDYGIRDFTVVDPDGYELVFGAPIGEECTNL